MLATGNNYIHYNLSIRVTADGFSFSVTEAASGDLMHREEHRPEQGMSLARTLSVALQRPTIQRNTYDSVRVVVDSDSTCVPMEEFRRDELDSLYAQVFDDADLVHNKILYTLLPQIDVVEVYAVNEAVVAAVKEVYPDAVLTSSYASVLGEVADFCAKRCPERQPLLAYIQSDQLFVISIYQGRLLYANSFDVDNQQNALYFLLSVWKELGLNAHENICFLAGEEETTTSLSEQLSEYLLHIEMMEVKV